MALIRLGGGVTGISGSIGGQTFSHNRYGPYIRSRTTPVNPRSAAQNKIRARVASIATTWSIGLTALQRAAWEVYADSIVMTNKLGAAIKLTGFNHFIRSNSARRYNDIPFVLDAPTNLTLPQQDGSMVATVDETNQEISVAFDDSLPWVDQDNAAMLVYMSMPKGVGVSFINGPFRVAGTIPGSSTSAPTSPQVIAVPFPVAIGQNIVVRARITEEDGRLSDYFRNQSSVAS